MSKAKILYVEDDLTLSFVTTDNLEIRGYEVDFCEDGLTALEMIGRKTYDLCILDVMLPKMDGFVLARKIREFNVGIPIIFLTARSNREDKIYGLQQGADDYLTKPFSIEELVLKIEIFLKRSKVELRNESLNRNIIFGMFSFSPDNQKIICSDIQFNLTHREAVLLEFLLKNKEKVVKREDILSVVWGNSNFFSSRTIDVFISRLRKILKIDVSVKIENIHNVGYRLTVSGGS